MLKAGLLSSASALIAHLADTNDDKFITRVRMEGGIPPLVELLQCDNVELQSAAAMALNCLAFHNEENKKQVIFTCNALPSLLQMLGSKDAAIFTHAAQVIGLLAIHSESITKSIIQAGALQPVMGLLRSCSSKDKMKAAGLIGTFAMSDSDCKVDTLAYHLSVLKDLFPKGINLLLLFSGIGGAEVTLYRLGISL